MKTITLTRKEAGADAGAVLSRILREAEQDTTILLEKGEYPLLTPIWIEGKEGIVFDGNGSTLVPFFNRELDLDPGSDVFHCFDSRRLVLKNFKICASQSANTAVRILDVNETYADIEVLAAEPFNGREIYSEGRAFTEDGRPLACYWAATHKDPSRRILLAGEVATTRSRPCNVPHEEIGPQQYRVYSTALKEFGSSWENLPPEKKNDYQPLRPGMLGCIEHVVYGPVACIFRSCEDVTVEDVVITNFGGFGFIILPRCADFVFRRLRIQTEDFHHQPYSTTGDGIHITGLGGKLLLEDCFFERLGDDPINLHTQVHLAREITGTSARVIHDKPGGVVPPAWTQQGDRLQVRDAETLEVKGYIPVEDFQDGIVRFASLPFTLTETDRIVNMAYYPDVVIRGCTVRHPRGRAFCFQAARSLLFENNFVDGIAGAGVYISSAFSYFFEAGAAQNVTIRNNRFLGRNLNEHLNNAAINVWIFGAAESQKVSHIYKNFTVTGNCFENLTTLPIYLSLIDGVEIRDNFFINCRAKEGCDMVVRDCADVKWSNNVSLRDYDCIPSVPQDGKARFVTDTTYLSELKHNR